MSIQSIQIPQTSASRAVLLGFVGTLIALVAFSDPLMQLANRWATQRRIQSWIFDTSCNGLAALGAPRGTAREHRSRGLDGSGCSAARNHYASNRREMSAIPILSQVGFVVALVGLTLSLGGYSLFRAAIVPILFLLFAIPMPDFIDSAISLQLQLVSSQLGAFFIRLAGIPVYLDGNVIDLGYYQVQVVEACSGLRYIYPLLSLSFLAAYFFKAPLWQRAMVFFSVVPIAIVMNSIRIGLVGVTVNYWGTQAADGVLHLFEGWFVFLICACILALEIYLLARICRQAFF